jgi:hypothetical protein
MKYLLMLYRDEAPLEDMRAMVGAFRSAVAEARAHGKRRGGNALRPSRETRTVSVRDGKTLIHDGPFADTKEQLAGYSVYECEDLAAAVRIAELLPWAAIGRVEIRPVAELGAQG